MHAVRKYNTYAFFFSETTLNEQNKGHYVNYMSKQFVFPRERLRLENELGHGEFGKVLSGVAMGILSGERETKVAVKTLKGNRIIHHYL